LNTSDSVWGAPSAFNVTSSEASTLAPSRMLSFVLLPESP